MCGEGEKRLGHVLKEPDFQSHRERVIAKNILRRKDQDEKRKLCVTRCDRNKKNTRPEFANRLLNEKKSEQRSPRYNRCLNWETKKYFKKKVKYTVSLLSLSLSVSDSRKWLKHHVTQIVYYGCNRRISVKSHFKTRSKIYFDNKISENALSLERLILWSSTKDEHIPH